MILVESIVGNINDANWKKQLEGATLDFLNLDQWQAQKNRFRLSSDAGAELAISLDRNSHLHDGDIVVWDAVMRTAVVARIQLQEVLVIQYSGLLALAQDALGANMLRTGACPGKSTLAGHRQRDENLCTAHRRSEGDGVRHENACVCRHHLRVSPRHRSHSLPRPARIQTSVRRCQCDAAFAHPRTRI